MIGLLCHKIYIKINKMPESWKYKKHHTEEAKRKIGNSNKKHHQYIQSFCPICKTSTLFTLSRIE